ncbi:hypothetical protein T459_11360 [Capsicum annuum]|uniref:Leucine-rich repeat-containing N-terminal plant-type domain-containing protein n=1 Tax=Capsicum annuum TaxID=4072 RepID=A0A2G2ZLP7_CAPAN|nr:hypothetical protein T459_11360 [Capsicum annuum]
MEKIFTSFLLLLHYVTFLYESWSPATSVCHWVGVTCGSSYQRVKSLNLPNITLTGRIPQVFGNLSFLVSLDLGSKKWHACVGLRIIPQEVGNLVYLVELAVEDNQITGSVLISLFNISLVQILSLERFLPQEIGNLTNTQRLQINGNRLIGEIPKEINNLIELEKLDLEANSYSGSLDMEILNISGLRIISLSDNNISGSLPPNIGSILPNIKELYMGSLTNLVGTIPNFISNCSKLTILELAENKLTGLIPNSLGYLTHLQHLNLGGNNLTNH